MVEHRRLNRPQQLTRWAGILLLLAGSGLALGGLALLGQGNVTAGLVFLGLGAFWFLSGGSALAWQRRHGRRRQDWRESRVPPPASRPRKKNDTAFPGYA
jgi:hypothetical protein